MFTGVPAPAAAGLALLPMILSFVVGADITRLWLLNAVVMLTVAVLMVSRVPTFSVKRLKIKPSMVIPSFILGVFVAVLLITEVWLMLSLIGLAYVISIPVSWVTAERMEREAATANRDAGSGESRREPSSAATATSVAPDAASSGDSPPGEPPAVDGTDSTGERGSVLRLDERGRRP